MSDLIRKPYLKSIFVSTYLALAISTPSITQAATDEARLLAAIDAIQSTNCLLVTAALPLGTQTGPADPSQYVEWKVYPGRSSCLEVISKPIHSKRGNQETFEALTYVLHATPDSQTVGILVEGCPEVGNSSRAEFTIGPGGKPAPPRTFQRYSGLSLYSDLDPSTSTLPDKLEILDPEAHGGLTEYSKDQWVSFAAARSYGQSASTVREVFSWKVDGAGGLPSEMVWHRLNADGSSFSKTHLLLRPGNEAHFSPEDRDAPLHVAQSLGVKWDVTTVQMIDQGSTAGRKHISRGRTMEEEWGAMQGAYRDSHPEH